MKISNYDQALSYLESFIGKIIFKVSKDKDSKLYDPLERMRIFLSLLDNPQNKFKSVLVGGTSGKGSTSYLISQILTNAGYKTGFTVSPHLQRINERLQISGKEISDKDFVKLTTSMIHIIKVMEKMDVGAPSYFEILIGMAFLYFAKEKVDIAVVEVGMGGEFDATNTLSPLIAVLTNVGLDHTNVLGKTVEKIAKTKAGIIKGLRINDKRLINNSSLITNHLIVVTGVKQPSVIKIIEDKCKSVGAKLLRLGKDFGLTKFKVALLGDYQKENASLAVEVVKQLKVFGFKVSEKTIKQSLQTAFFPGRFEVIKIVLRQAQNKISSTLILDGAHNPTKMRAFLQSLEKLYPKEKKIFVIGFKNDKEISKMLKHISKVADHIIATEFHAKTDMALSASSEAESIKDKVLGMKYGREIAVEKNSGKALKKAFKISNSISNSIIVVTGSLYLVGEIRNLIEKRA